MDGIVAEIICVGDEILMGRTLDTNSNWLSKRLYQMGARIRRITVVGDDLQEISSAIKEACSRKADWLIITGGLGPTYDDKTLHGLALAAGKQLKFDEDAMNMVNESVKRRGIVYMGDEQSITEGRRKMATIPEGSRPLPNPVGTAPGVLTKIQETNVVSLPGVPDEMKAIFDSAVAELISSSEVKVKSVDVVVYGIPEAAMAGMISELVAKYPDLYIKSHPSGYEKVSKVVVQFTGRERNAQNVEHAVNSFKEWLDKRKASYELAL
jgi:molybdenum cofactor synthesis domain-containing protein